MIPKISKVASVAVLGMEAVPVEIEVDVGSGGLPDFHIVGLPSQAVREARKRVRAAVESSECEWPQRRITGNLAPGDLRKEGPMFDLPLALGVMRAVEKKKLDATRVKEYLVVGELALDGKLRPIRGALAVALAARDRGLKGVVVPKQNAPEAALVPGINVMGVESLLEAAAFMQGELNTFGDFESPESLLAQAGFSYPDFSDVRGQALARRALEIAAAGGHNILMVGPPGCGKTMLARRLPGILPPLTVAEALEITKVWSVAGLLEPDQPMVVERPFRAPHHHASPAAVIGGGHLVPRPGEISIAHCGILFLDELPLFQPGILDALRQPLEEGCVTVARQGACIRFPSSFCLVGAANPCPCGRFGDLKAACSCSPARLESYRSRLSGPLLDRIDLHVEVASLSHDELMSFEPSEPSTQVRERVMAARTFRSQQSGRGARRHAATLKELAPTSRRLLSLALLNQPSSARGVQRVLRVARTIADLAACEAIEEEHIAEALQFRRCVWEK